MYSCQTEEKPIQDFSLNIRLANDPGRVNPMVGNPTDESNQVNSLIFLPLAHYDPITYEMSPVLIKEVPDAKVMEDGTIVYDYEFLEDAVWDDGKPITAEDYLFTMKVAMNPKVDAVSWRGLLANIDSIGIDASNDRKFSVIIKEYFLLAKEASCTFEIFPKHIYDPEGILDAYSLQDVVNSEESDSILSEFAKTFNSVKYSKEIVSGSGPYKLKAWEIDQYIALERKENYWGDKYPERKALENNPKEVIFRIISDENAAVTLLKDGSLDLMVVKSATIFENLKNSSNFDSLFTLATPELARFYYIGLNNRKPELADKDVRRALAHLIDVDLIINNLENGYATRQLGTIMPNSEYYNRSLSEIDFDIKKANAILDNEGWKDTNGNGVRDKIIDGQLVELEVEYVASQSPLGQKVGLLFQDNAKQAGVDVKMIIKEGRKFNEAMYALDFEASASAAGYSLAPYDPYQRWHSDNSDPKEGNFAGYVNERNDELIELIRTAEDLAERTAAYKEFQQLMYDEQPVIFLYSPTQKFVLNKKFKGLFSMKRPGYFVGSFEFAE
ncbi:peptide-binding protein [Portibacter lacus]|uniref:Peptide-binding protein n=2 Tax=Portibacter lacus TaxID=1099794 RepID=A0AA37SS62_9BACT|nr:peptide-binding protein [Portibacter lacus]